jgi:DNA-binding GntR family transcriptional regulator
VNTVIGHAVSALRNAIMQGHLAPGQKLVESELAAALRVSRPSLREALRVLEAERLVNLIPNRGPFVSKLGRQQVEEIHEIWALLTGDAVFRFVAAATKEDLDEIEGTVAKIEETMPRGTVLQRIEAINRFFGLILARSANAILAEMVGSLVCRINFLRARSLSDSAQAARSAKEIRAIAHHMRHRNADASRAATQAHIASVCSAALEIHAQPVLDTRQVAQLLRSSAPGGGDSWYKSTKIRRRPVAP